VDGCDGCGKNSDLGKSGKSAQFGLFLNVADYLALDRSIAVCVLLLAVATADPLAQLEKLAEIFDLRADAPFLLQDRCRSTPFKLRTLPKRLAVLRPLTTTSAIVRSFTVQTPHEHEKITKYHPQ
jgi:hypothetical protein